MASPRKRQRLSLSNLAERLFNNAAALPFPITNCLGETTRNFFINMARAHETTVGMIVMGLLPTIATSLGHKTKYKMMPAKHGKARTSPMNLYVLVLCPPSAGKTSGYVIGVDQPMMQLTNEAGIGQIQIQVSLRNNLYSCQYKHAMVCNVILGM